MRQDVQDLLELQEVDQEINEVKATLVQIPKRQEAAKERLANDQAAVAAAKAALQENQAATKTVELDVGTRRNSIDRLKKQQFETKKNEEYTKLGEEVVRYEEQVDELETKELELMEKSDELSQKIDEAQAALATTQKFVDEEIAELAGKGKKAEERLANCQELRTRKASEVEEELLSIYDRLFVKREGVAVAPVSSERSCASCHLQVTPATYALAQSGAEVAHCDNCGAILHT